MNELKLEHLAPYLPYGLNVTFEGDEYIHKVVGLNITERGVELISPFEHWGTARIEDCIPVFRPLSDLTKEIEHNGEKFVPILELAKVSDSYYDWEISKESLFHKSAFCNHYTGKISFSINTDFKKLYSINTTLNGYFMQTNNPHLVYQKIIEWRFDVFGLREKNLCVYYNEI